MSEQTSTSGASGGNPAEPGSTEGAGTPVVPEGFVPVAELERERQRAREFQSRYDQLQAAQSGAGGGAGSTSASEGEPQGSFDPEQFRLSLLRDVYGVNQMVQATVSLKAEFPHADPALFSPDRVAQFKSPEALRFAVEDSHKRVAAILDSERAAIEARLREELAASGNGATGAGPAGTPPAPGGDPTPEQLLAMDPGEWDRLEEANPGVIERVLAAASQ